MSLDKLRAWPAMAGIPDDLEESTLPWEQGVWGKAQGAASDFRWLARSDGLVLSQSEINMGHEQDEPARSYSWRVPASGHHIALRTYPSRARDKAGRRKSLEKQALECATSLPAAVVALATLPKLRDLDHNTWWDRRTEADWTDRNFSLPIAETNREPLTLSPAELADTLDTGIRQLKERTTPAELAQVFYALQHGRSPVCWILDGEPLEPEALAVLLLPFPREKADTLSILGTTFSSRNTTSQLKEQWDLVICPQAPKGATELPDVSESFIIDVEDFLNGAPLSLELPAGPSVEIEDFPTESDTVEVTMDGMEDPAPSIVEPPTPSHAPSPDGSDQIRQLMGGYRAQLPLDEVDWAAPVASTLPLEVLEANAASLRELPNWSQAALDALPEILSKLPDEAKKLTRGTRRVLALAHGRPPSPADLEDALFNLISSMDPAHWTSRENQKVSLRFELAQLVLGSSLDVRYRWSRGLLSLLSIDEPIWTTWLKNWHPALIQMMKIHRYPADDAFKASDDSVANTRKWNELIPEGSPAALVAQAIVSRTRSDLSSLVQKNKTSLAVLQQLKLNILQSIWVAGVAGPQPVHDVVQDPGQKSSRYAALRYVAALKPVHWRGLASRRQEELNILFENSYNRKVPKSEQDALDTWLRDWHQIGMPIEIERVARAQRPEVFKPLKGLNQGGSHKATGLSSQGQPPSVPPQPATSAPIATTLPQGQPSRQIQTTKEFLKACSQALNESTHYNMRVNAIRELKYQVRNINNWDSEEQVILKEIAQLIKDNQYG